MLDRPQTNTCNSKHATAPHFAKRPKVIRIVFNTAKPHDSSNVNWNPYPEVQPFSGNCEGDSKDSAGAKKSAILVR
jgi:hypothetical protein